MCGTLKKFFPEKLIIKKIKIKFAFLFLTDQKTGMISKTNLLIKFERIINNSFNELFDITCCHGDFFF